MHTLRTILAGITLLLALLTAGWLWRGSAGAALAAGLFVPVWLACSLANLRVGVTRAGYRVREELPVLAVVFLAPAVVAWAAWRWLAG